MRSHVLAFRSLNTVTLLLLDQTCQFEFSRLMASKPCNQLDAVGGRAMRHARRAQEALGWTMGLRYRPRLLLSCRDPDCTCHGASDTIQQTPTGTEMGSRHTASIGTRRGEGVACGAPRRSTVFTERTESCTKARSSLQKLSWQ